MNVFVVDASVVVKWLVPEIHSDAARRLLVLPHEYVAPDLLFAETANTIWKKIRRGELTAEEGQQLVADIGSIAGEARSVPRLGGGRTRACERDRANRVRLDVRCSGPSTQHALDYRGRPTRSCVERFRQLRVTSNSFRRSSVTCKRAITQRRRSETC